MKKTSVLVFSLFVGSLLLTGCAAGSHAHSPNKEVAANNTDPRVGPVSVDDHNALLYIKVCDGLNLIYSNPNKGGIVVTDNSPECVK